MSVGSRFTCSAWPSGRSKRGGEELLSPPAAVHAVPSAWGLPSPQPLWAPGGPSLLAAAPADLRAGCLVQGNLGPDCLHLSHNARFHSGPLALVHGGASCPPLPLENQRIQLEEFSGVLPHPPSPPSDGAGPVGGFSEGIPHPTGTLRLNPGPINLGAPPPVRASGQASQAAAHRGQLSWSPQVTGAVPVKTRGRRQEGWSCRQPWCKTAPCHQHPTTW